MKEQQSQKEKKQRKEGKEHREIQRYGHSPVKGVSEPIQQMLKHHEIATSVRRHQHTRRILVHPKDKVEDSKKTDCVYQIPCKSCYHTYISVAD